MQLLPGQIGHFLVLISFTFSLASGFAYYRSLKSTDDAESWLKLGRWLFIIHGLAVVGVVASLYYIISNHLYEYHYAWSHSSNNLPRHYMISCFWEGQEGSFLLWIFWHVILGALLVWRHPKWESTVMMVFMMVQAFLASMILGVVIPGIELKIGSSPFILLREFMTDAPIFKMNPEFIPEDGTGLNPLLQNYWMVIHPPTLFLGFAATLVPFAFLIGGLITGKTKSWIQPAMPWALFATLSLGTGIMMGAYWAYETLNFGGYWNWDPVENAVYIPWLVLVAAVHTMFSGKANPTALKASMFLVVATFILILYSTFLTRSGILGDTSVHSFTDLGLSGQLLLYLLFFLFFSIFILVRNWKNLPVDEKEIGVYSREFWIFAGVTALSLAAFQVIMTTSIPVFNAIINNLGIDSSLAPPADPIAHYSNLQIWFAIAIAILSGIGPFFWWGKMDKDALKKGLSTPLILTLITTTAIILIGQIRDFSYILLLTAGVFSLFANGNTFLRIFKTGFRLTGGSITHLGIAFILIGILFSSGYSKILSLNQSGKIYHTDFPEDLNLENILLWRNKALNMGSYNVTYRGPRLKVRPEGVLIDKEKTFKTDIDDYVILNYEPENLEKTIFDTVRIFAEDTYYEIDFEDSSGNAFTLFPRAQVNPDMGGLLASPDIKQFFASDLYTHVSSIIDPEKEPEWEDKPAFSASIGDTIFLADYPAVFEGVERVNTLAGVLLEEEDVAIEGNFRVFRSRGDILLKPAYLIKDQMIGRLPDVNMELGIKLNIEKIDPENGIFDFTLKSTQPDYVILKAVKKPWINLLWGGTLMMILGMSIAMTRRFRESNS